MMNDLQKLVDKYRALKPHYYIRQYERLFGPIRNQVKKVLEIGINGGASMRVWKDYFPRAHVYGLDIKDFNLRDPRLTAFVGDQSDPVILQEIAKHGPFDIIIDDGSHKPAHWLVSHNYLADSVIPDGYYIVEDLQAAKLQDIYTAEDLAQMLPAVSHLMQPMISLRGERYAWMELHCHLLIMCVYKDFNDQTEWWEHNHVNVADC